MGDTSSKFVPPAPDDAYWAALFQQEEAGILLPRESGFDDLWADISSLIEKRSTNADGDRPLASLHNSWQIAQAHYESEEVIELKVAGYNKGGLLVRWNGLPGFVPASQLIELPQLHVEVQRLKTLKEWVDKDIRLKIIEVNEQANRLILSERATQSGREQRTRLFSEIEAGSKLEGRVTNLTHFGAFVDLGGVEGLIHISELSWSRVVHPGDIVQPGQSVIVLVLSVDSERERIALSLKQLRPNPWLNIESRYRPGQLVNGIVSRVVSFGAFVLLEDELEGLIHISELAEGTMFHPRNVIQQGDKVVAKVLSVDGQAKRLALTLRHERST